MTLLAWFVLCMTGPCEPSPGCALFLCGDATYNLRCVQPDNPCDVDWDNDCDVDLRDFALLQNAHHQ